MKKIISAIAFLVAVSASGVSWASNTLSVISDSDFGNSATLDIAGNYNALSISQSFDGLGPANTIGLQINGDLNGGPLGAAFTGQPALLQLAPGTIAQSGHDNLMSIAISGSGNLFAAVQSGSQNLLSAKIVGNYNQAAVSQTGSGNSLAFTQSGTGNSLSVVQRSW